MKNTKLSELIKFIKNNTISTIEISLMANIMVSEISDSITIEKINKILNNSLYDDFDLEKKYPNRGLDKNLTKQLSECKRLCIHNRISYECYVLLENLYEIPYNITFTSNNENSYTLIYSSRSDANIIIYLFDIIATTLTRIGKQHN